jgi:hypothetical protein
MEFMAGEGFQRAIRARQSRSLLGPFVDDGSDRAAGQIVDGKYSSRLAASVRDLEARSILATLSSLDTLNF